MPLCTYGCGVSHRLAPSPTNCKNFPHPGSSVRRAGEMSALHHKSLGSVEGPTTGTGNAAAMSLNGYLPDDMYISGKYRGKLVEGLRDNDEYIADNFDEEEDFEQWAKSATDKELLDEAFSLGSGTAENHTVCGDGVRFVHTEREVMTDASSAVTEHAAHRLGGQMMQDNPELFRDRRDASRFAWFQFMQWNRLQQNGSRFNNEESLFNSLPAYDPHTDEFDYDFPADGDDNRKRRRQCEALVRAQYALTQQRLRDMGITEVTVSRGMGWVADSDDWPDEDRKPWERTPVAFKEQFRQMEPGAFGDEDFEVADSNGKVSLFRQSGVASFSTDEDIARQFATSHGEYVGPLMDNAVVVRTTVPASEVLALPTTGCGMFSESEIIVHGKPHKETHCDMQFLRRGE